MKLTLKNSYEKMVKQLVSTGMYRSAEDVIEDALEVLADRDREYKRREEWLQKALASGLLQSKRGLSKALDIEEMKRRGRAERAARRKAV